MWLRKTAVDVSIASLIHSGASWLTIPLKPQLALNVSHFGKSQFSDHIACSALLDGYSSEPLVLGKDKATRAAQPFAAQTSIKAFFGGAKTLPGKVPTDNQSQSDPPASQPTEELEASPDNQPADKALNDKELSNEGRAVMVSRQPAPTTATTSTAAQKRAATAPFKSKQASGKRTKTDAKAKPTPARSVSAQSLVDRMFARSKSNP
jgi:hypothetical protein